MSNGPSVNPPQHGRIQAIHVFPSAIKDDGEVTVMLLVTQDGLGESGHNGISSFMRSQMANIVVIRS